jgi:hypothetical protein
MTMTHDALIKTFSALPGRNPASADFSKERCKCAPLTGTLSQLSGTGLIRLAMDPAGGRMVSKSHILIWPGLCKHSGRSSMWGVR